MPLLTMFPNPPRLEPDKSEMIERMLARVGVVMDEFIAGTRADNRDGRDNFKILLIEVLKEMRQCSDSMHLAGDHHRNTVSECAASMWRTMIDDAIAGAEQKENG